jgi:hypothetical protein
METVLEFVARMTDLVKVKNWYTIPYETGLLMIMYQLLHPHRVPLPSFSCSSEVAVSCAVVVAFLAGAPNHVFPLSSSTELQLALSSKSSAQATTHS